MTERTSRSRVPAARRPGIVRAGAAHRGELVVRNPRGVDHC